ncbi:MFS transporter [Allokutzneria sp. A3M-2-11 16]|uniref:MFS transporter n=1 Tax=Allokutzneria sp. A3M-2-11 16 TaxID=2962043 RepID=UPI0020B76C7C|nr:MFS transporter [Allokutzneria sp. A3M-2-11 16]MCP3798050.1 MFS transporter [Allokutzneria sp. A3M-2-11 16]
MEAPLGRDLLLVVSGVGVSVFGTMLTTLTLLLSLSEHGPLAVALVLAAELVPVAFGAPVVGLLVDRLPNRRLLIGAQLVQAAAVAALIPALGSVPLSALIAFCYGFGTAVTKPAATALLPRITGEEGATRGYAAWGTASTIGMLLGSGLGGVLITEAGPTVALLVDVATLLFQAALLLFVRAERDPRLSTPERKRGAAVAGMRHLRADTVLVAITSGGAVVLLATVLVNVAEVFFVTDVLLAGGVVLGIMAACWGSGKLLASRIAARASGERALLRMLGAGGVLMGTALVVAGSVPHVVVACAMWVVAGIANGFQNLGTQALTSLRSPEELRGRVFAAVSAVMTTSNMLGTVAAAGVIAVLGPRWTLVGGGSLALVAAVLTYRVATRRTARVD